MSGQTMTRDQWTKGWIDWLVWNAAEQEKRLQALENRMIEMSANFDALQAEWTQFKADVSASAATLVSKCNALTQQVQNAPNDNAAIDQMTADMKTAHAQFDTLVNPPAPPADQSQAAPGAQQQGS